MTKDDISKWIHMAWDFTSEDNLKRKFEYQEAHYIPYEKFARLVAEHERDACIDACWHISAKYHGIHHPAAESVADECAGAIRARGEK